MGWLYYTDLRVQTYADEKAEITRLCTSHGDTRKTELVKACKDGSTWYAAAQVTSIDGSTCQIVTATHYRRGRQKRRCYRIEETGGLLRLSKATFVGSEVIGSAKGAVSPVWAEYLAGRE